MSKKAVKKPNKNVKIAYRKFRNRRYTNIAVGAAALVFVALLGLWQTHSAFPSGIFSPPASIASNCSTNVSVALQSWINSVPDNSTLLFPKSACYRIDDKLRIVNRHGLTFDGQGGATFKPGTDGREFARLDARSRDQFMFQNDTDILVKNLIARGANPDNNYYADVEAQHGFDILGSTNVTLDTVQAYDVFGDFVYVGQNSLNTVVRNSTFARDGRQGISVTYAKNTLIENNNLTSTRRSTFDFEPSANSWTIDGVTVRNNSIGPGRLNTVASAGYCAVVKNIDFEGNKLTGKAMDIQVTTPGPATCNTRRSNITVKGNTTDFPQGNPKGATMIFGDIDNLILDHNTVPGAVGRGMHIAYLVRTNTANVTNNILLNNLASIYTDAASRNICFSGNMIGNPLRLEPASPPCVSQTVPPPLLPPPPPVVVNPEPPSVPTEDEISGGPLGDAAPPTTSTSTSQPASGQPAARVPQAAATANTQNSPPVSGPGSKSGVLDAVTDPSSYVEQLPKSYVAAVRWTGMTVFAIVAAICIVAEFAHFRKTHQFYKTLDWKKK